MCGSRAHRQRRESCPFACRGCHSTPSLRATARTVCGWLDTLHAVHPRQCALPACLHKGEVVDGEAGAEHGVQQRRQVPGAVGVAAGVAQLCGHPVQRAASCSSRGRETASVEICTGSPALAGETTTSRLPVCCLWASAWVGIPLCCASPTASVIVPPLVHLADKQLHQ